MEIVNERVLTEEAMKHHMDLDAPWTGAIYGPCSKVYQVSFESMWLAPLPLLMSLITPYAYRIRWDGKRTNNNHLLYASYKLLFIAWLLPIIFAMLADGVTNHGMPPQDTRRFSVGQLLLIWSVAFPIYIVMRDMHYPSKVCCPTNANCSYCCLSCSLYNKCIASRLPKIVTLTSTASTTHDEIKSSVVDNDEDNLQAAPEVNGRLTAVFASEFWEWAMMGLGSLAIPWLCFWNLFQCYNLFNEIGHWVPFLSFAAYSGCLLLFSGKSQRNKLSLQVTEGWLWILFGITFNVYMSLFGPGAGGFIQFWLAYSKQDRNEWLFAQQHFFMTFTDILCGFASIMLARAKIKTGIPILLLALLNWYTLNDHMQPCNLALLYHKLTGLNFLVMGIARYFDRIREASLCMMFTGATFLAASPCTMAYLDSTFTFSATFFVVYGYHGMLWAWVLYLNYDYINSTKHLLLSTPDPEDMSAVLVYRDYDTSSVHPHPKNNSKDQNPQQNGFHGNGYNKIAAMTSDAEPVSMNVEDDDS